jgi:hypothetical protein
MIQWYRDGKFPVEKLVKFYPVGQLVQACGTRQYSDRLLGREVPGRSCRYAQWCHREAYLDMVEEPDIVGSGRQPTRHSTCKS